MDNPYTQPVKIILRFTNYNSKHKISYLLLFLIVLSAGCSNSTTDKTTDNQPPIINAFTINNGGESTSDFKVTLNISATDNIGIVGYYASETDNLPAKDDQGWKAVESTPSLINYNIQYSFTPITEPGYVSKIIYLWLIDKMNNVSGVASAAINLSVPLSSAQTEITVWNFDNEADPLTADIGTGTAELSFYDPSNTGWGQSQTKFAKASASGLPLTNGKDVWVMGFPAATAEQGYKLTHNSQPNGVYKAEDFVSNYTIIVDILFPSGSSNYKSLYQTDIYNLDEAEFFITDSGIGINNVYNGTILPDAWYRIAVGVQCALGPGGTGRISKFINGIFVGGQTTPGNGPNCRWALDKYFYLFTDNDGETDKGYVSSILFTDRLMSMEEIKVLGSPSGFGANYPGPASQDVQEIAERRARIIAHRGNSCCAPENTISAINQAFDMNADHLELDIRLTSDGELVLMHDEDVARTTDGKGLVSGLTLSDIKNLDAGSWMDNSYTGEQVPTLTEALIASKGKGKILLDVKSINVGSVIKKALNEAEVGTDAIWVVQNANIEDFKNNLPGSILWGTMPEQLTKETFDALKADGVVGFEIDVSVHTLTEELINTVHENGMIVIIYTIMDPSEMLRFINMGVDGIETDYPDVMNSLMPE